MWKRDLGKSGTMLFHLLDAGYASDLIQGALDAHRRLRRCDWKVSDREWCKLISFYPSNPVSASDAS